MIDEDGRKWLPAARLAELLATLPADSRVMPNGVGNLLALSADGEQLVAYVDLAEGGSVEPLA